MKSNPFNHSRLHHTIYAFEHRTRLLWRIFPVIKLTMVTVLTKPWSINLFIKTLKSFPETINSLPLVTEHSEPPSAEVIIAYSSEKPSWYPALRDLSLELTKSSVKTYLIQKGVCGPVGFAPNRKISILNYISFWSKFGAISKGFLCTLLVSFALMSSLKTFHVLMRLPLIFYEIVRSYLRISQIRMILKIVQPKIVITNGEHLPTCSELMLCSKEYGIYTIWFYNEWPQSGFIPYLADEIWTWNAVSKAALESVIPSSMGMKITVIGHAESEYCHHVYGDSNIDDDLKWIEGSGRPLLIFLSDFTGRFTTDSSAEKEALEIIRAVALSFDTWNFLVKPKVFQFRTALPGEEVLKNLSNCRILRKKSSLGPFLNSQFTKVVVSCQSSGLLVAAGQRKIAVRLFLPGADAALEYIDCISKIVKTSDELKSILKSFNNDTFFLKFDYSQIFPYKGYIVLNVRNIVQDLLKFDLLTYHTKIRKFY